MSATAVSPRPVVLALAAVIDVVAVLVFAAVGRASHDEPVLPGLALTAWPFLVALAVGWVALLAWRRPTAPLRTGIGVWLVTVAGGMLLRAVSGQGVALAFVIVATIVLFVVLVGWRALATLVRRRR